MSIDGIIASRREMIAGLDPLPENPTAEGGCGVLGYIATVPTSGKYLDRPLEQMHNRGNGKGGGVAALGCFGDRAELFAVQIGYLHADQVDALDPEIRAAHIDPKLEIVDREVQPTLDDHRDAGLEIRPPVIVRYFCKVRPEARDALMREADLHDEDLAQTEVIFRNTFELNKKYYAEGEPRAFVLSHGRNLAVFKAVGYAEQVGRYYKLEDLKAHGWIGHQRYPTRGRVWHPGGAHPFIGVDAALVHNGDFANYHACAEYLLQHGLRPLFITDTEVASLNFDLLTRVYGYPLEHVVEALAPTSELDFLRLDKRKQRVYQALRASHLHGSPDGPWFFIITRNEREKGLELIGITDTSMLRPQVFALGEGPIGIGAVASEKQAVDAVFQDIAADHPGFCPVPDRVWNARGGSHTDGGAFVFRAVPDGHGGHRMVCENKFGARVGGDKIVEHVDLSRVEGVETSDGLSQLVTDLSREGRARGMFRQIAARIGMASPGEIRGLGARLVAAATEGETERAEAIELLTLLRDRHYDPGPTPRASLLALWDKVIDDLFDSTTMISAETEGAWRRIDWAHRSKLRPALENEHRLVIDARDFPPEGRESAARLIAEAHDLGWNRFSIYRCTGDRFIGTGLGVGSHDVRIDAYGSTGDYLGSSIDGAEIHVHGDAQDQVGQIMKSGTVVIHGHCGQALLYGAKGGRMFIRGHVGGRALINAVGRIQAVINGTCLDYAAESFMAGRPLGDGYILINGLEFDERGNVVGLELKYPGSTFFSLASGGAGYLNDPYQTVTAKQLNGAEFADFAEDDWQFIYPVLRENQRHFGITVEGDLQTVDGVFHWPQDIFRKVIAVTAA